MYSIELMIEEHKNILKLIEVIKNACCGILDGAEVNIEDFEKMIQFCRNYADKHHHGKEEVILFKKMTEKLGALAEKLINHGMLVEHDLGRLYMSELETSLNQYKNDPKTIYKLGIIGGATGYANLLTRHIDKEDNAVYKFAEKQLSPEVLETVDELVRSFEKEAEEQSIQKKYLAILDELTKKYPSK
jgi:hemerythrin-like domain-containing protein